MKMLLTILAMVQIVLHWTSIAAEPVRTPGSTVPLEAGAASQPTIKLKMISGTAQRRAATINDQTFFAGETFKVAVGNGKIAVQCLTIGETSATVKCEGEADPVELKVGQIHRLGAALVEPPKKPEVVKNPKTLPAMSPELRKQLKQYDRAGVITLNLIVILYFPFCWSCRQLCRRAGVPSMFLVWLPGFKRLALFKATEVSRVFFVVGLIIPFVGFVAWVVCCVRLCGLFERSKLWALLMIFPVLGWPVFMYLAWASRSEDNEPTVMRREYAM